MAEGQAVFQMPAPGSQAEAMVLAEFARRTGLIPAAAYGGAEAAAAAARDLERGSVRACWPWRTRASRTPFPRPEAAEGNSSAPQGVLL